MEINGYLSLVYPVMKGSNRPNPPMVFRELLLEELEELPYESDMVMHVHFAPALIIYVSMIQTGSDL